ncbi:tetratricopeptide repeat-containing sensor histidine kinase [Saccharicrinis aurantiacus]|uniref:tetratricopeptide repeat-containing sensor histidine kinase n=1 Tax=Saccharicrinis aurantiacus TaxID=1849719 RepID=UPI002490186A|nr:tetratricopeptide repeat protein [Saccharicrinis aurantiacus]
MRLLIAMAILLISNSLYSINTADSIYQIAEELIDSENLEELHELAFSLRSKQSEVAEDLSKKLIANAGESIKHKGFGYHDLGEALFYQEKYHDSQEKFLIALEYFEQASNEKMIAKCYNDIGTIKLRLGVYDDAYEYNEKALKLHVELGDSLSQGKDYLNMGVIFGLNGKYEMEAECYSKALGIFHELNDSIRAADISINLALIQVELKKYDEAKASNLFALDLYKTLNNRSRIAAIYTNLGYLHLSTKEYDQSRVYFDDAISLYEDINEKFGLLHALQGRGDLFVIEGDKAKAIETYLKCEEVNDGIGILSVQVLNLKALSDTYKSMNNFENALRVSEKYHIINDSIFSKESRDKFLELDKKYERDKNLNEIEVLKSKNRFYYIILIAVISILILGCVLVYFRFRYRRLRNKERLLQLEQKVLRTQMNPHFIFNSLSAIQCYILDNKVIDAVDFLADFAGLMRMVLEYSQEEYITLKQEYDLLQYYLSLQNKRFGERINYTIEIEEELKDSNYKIPPMLAQPFIENSFEHGELNKMENGLIEVRFKKYSHGQIKLVVEDNGVGINSSKGTDKGHKSLATSITKERLKIINKTNSLTKLQLRVEDRSVSGKQGTKVEFTIPAFSSN